MSGFFGMLRTDGMAVEPRFLDQVAQHLRFRGPDGGQTWVKDGLGTCFSYLETGTRHQSRSQPVRLADRYTLLGEVRLDARKQLVEELEKNQIRATEDCSDQELLLHAWSVWGGRSVNQITGRLLLPPVGRFAAIAFLRTGFCWCPAIFLCVA